MSAQTDFALTIDRAAGLLLDSTCAARAAGARPLPHPHRRRLNTALRKLEGAQQDLFLLRSDPWETRTPTQARQLELL